MKTILYFLITCVFAGMFAGFALERDAWYGYVLSLIVQGLFFWHLVALKDKNGRPTQLAQGARLFVKVYAAGLIIGPLWIYLIHSNWFYSFIGLALIGLIIFALFRLAKWIVNKGKRTDPRDFTYYRKF